MKTKLVLLAIIGLMNIQLFAQVKGNMNYTAANYTSGNVNFQTNQQFKVQLDANQINIPFVNTPHLNFSIKGMSNVKADSYVAIFNITQAGKTAEEVNKLIDERINLVTSKIKEKANASYYIDMLSFVPMYEYDVVKKLFSKTTYNEIPVGFEIKKNLHVKYTDPNYLNDLIAFCATSEIYDLVRVDLFSDSLEQKKQELIEKAKKILNQKMKNKEYILEVDFKSYSRQMVDGFKVYYPIEMYSAYQAHMLNSIKVSSASKVNTAGKATTFYYKPIIDKEFDFVINPIIFEPVIQIIYEIKLRLIKKPKETPKPIAKKEVQIKKEIQVQKEVVIVTQNGQIKTIRLGR